MANFNTEHSANPEEYNFSIQPDPALPEMQKEMKEIIDAFTALGPVPTETLSPENARQNPELRDAFLGVLQKHFFTRAVKGVTIPVKEVKHLMIPTPEGELLARVYNPNPKKSLPVLLYFHGGGFVIASLNTYDASCRALADAAQCIVVSVAYRQAPEHVYPAAHDDAFWSYKWLVENSTTIGGNGKIAIGGESAGGNLAASVCLRARGENFKLPLHQLLIYPVVDNDMSRQSYVINENAKPLNKAMMEWFFSHYYKATSLSDEIAFPLKATLLNNLPSASVLTAEIDPLCSEGEIFAEQLAQSGVKVFQKRYLGVTHEFFGLGAYVPQAMDALKDAATQLKEAFEEEEEGLE